MKISASAHRGLTEVLRELWQIIDTTKEEDLVSETEETAEEIPVITLKQTEKKHRPHHERYQKGDRNTIIMLDSLADAEDEYSDIEE